MASNTAVPPVALNQDNVPDDLICSICMTVPTKPLITPCYHIFCHSCIHQALNVSNICPIDRRPCTTNQLQPLEGALSRIWGGIQVKCGGHDSGCAWRGSISDYEAHTQGNNCCVDRAQAGNHNNEAIEELQSKIQEKDRIISDLKEFVKTNLDLTTRLVNEFEAERRTLQNDLIKAEDDLRARPNVPKLFHGRYDFRRENVVQLSQLISRYLECKPSHIDSNKIYNCVRSCFVDFEKGHKDNPAHYFLDMRMLLATCLASTWFTDNQRRNMRQWNRDHFGSY